MSIERGVPTPPPMHSQPVHDGASLAERRPRTTLAILQDSLVMTTIGLLGLALWRVLDRMCELAPASSLAMLLPLQRVCGTARAMAVCDGRINGGSQLTGAAPISKP